MGFDEVFERSRNNGTFRGFLQQAYNGDVLRRVTSHRVAVDEVDFDDDSFDTNVFDETERDSDMQEESSGSPSSFVTVSLASPEPGHSKTGPAVETVQSKMPSMDSLEGPAGDGTTQPTPWQRMSMPSTGFKLTSLFQDGSLAKEECESDKLAGKSTPAPAQGGQSFLSGSSFLSGPNLAVFSRTSAQPAAEDGTAKSGSSSKLGGISLFPSTQWRASLR